MQCLLPKLFAAALQPTVQSIQRGKARDGLPEAEAVEERDGACEADGASGE